MGQPKEGPSSRYFVPQASLKSFFLFFLLFTLKHMPCLSACGVSADSRRSMLMDLGPEKVTSTCPENFAELDPDCSSRLLGAGKRFKGGAEACRLSLTWPRRLPPASQYVWTPSQRG